MTYRLKKGIVLLRMCGEEYLFPCREAGIPISFLVSLSPEISDVLVKEIHDHEDTQAADAERNILKQGQIPEDSESVLYHKGQLSPEAEIKLERLVKIGFVEECE